MTTGRKLGSSQFWIDCNYCKKEAVFEKLDKGEHKEGQLCQDCGLWVCDDCVNWLESEPFNVVCSHCKPLKMKKRLDKLKNTRYASDNDDTGIIK